MRRLLIATCALVLLALPAAARDIQRVVSPGGIVGWLIQEKRIPIVALEAAWRGGSALEPAGKEGLATLATALLDDGSGPDEDLAFHAKLEALAIEMSFSAGRDSLRGSLRTLSENREAAFRLFGQALTQPRFDAEPLNRARTQMLVGLERAESNPQSVAGRAWSAAAFPGHPYGRPSDGTRESLPTITADELRGFVKQRLGRDNIDAGEFARLLDLAFGGLPATTTVASVPEVAPATAEKPIVIRRPLPQSVVLFGEAGLKRADPDWYAATILNYILGGGGFASRLMEEVREKRGLAYGVSTALQPFRAAALHAGSVATRNDAVAESLRLIRAEYAKLRDTGVTEEELANAKAYLTGSFPLQMTTSGRIAGMLVSIQQENLGIDYIDRYKSLIDSVTLADVNRVAKRLLDPDKLLTVIVGQPVGIDG